MITYEYDVQYGKSLANAIEIKYCDVDGDQDNKTTTVFLGDNPTENSILEVIRGLETKYYSFAILERKVWLTPDAKIEIFGELAENDEAAK